MKIAYRSILNLLSLCLLTTCENLPEGPGVVNSVPVVSIYYDGSPLENGANLENSGEPFIAGTVLSFSAATDDPDGDELTYRWLVGGSVQDDQVSTTFDFSRLPTEETWFEVTFEAYDGKATVSTTINVLIAAAAGPLPDAIYVSTTGVDNVGSGYSLATPVRTIAYGIMQADSMGKHEVRISAGIYNEIVTIIAGINLIGEPETIIVGEFDVNLGIPLTVKALDLSSATELSGLTIQAPDTTIKESFGSSTYSVYVRNSADFLLDGIKFIGGDAADQNSGTHGSSASSIRAISGGAGGDSEEYTTSCDSISRGVGGGGAGGGGALYRTGGGDGGDGGTMDTSCGSIFSNDYDATAGQAGTNANEYITDSSGYRGSGGLPDSAGQDGRDGWTLNGTGGVTPSEPGEINSNLWLPTCGADGHVGSHGTGGGGGGGSGGSDEGIDSYGAGGGGGGSGGVRSSKSGEGGYSGGSSFCLFTMDSSLTIKNCDFILGNGGDGGAGGNGGSGQAGGFGGSGGLASGDSKSGGDGGDGGDGGSSGGGGGGHGGNVYGIFAGFSQITRIGNTFSGGNAGLGGNGGYGPFADNTDDGTSGMNGEVLSFHEED